MTKHVSPQDTQTPLEPLVTAPEMAEALRCSSRTLTNWELQGRIPPSIRIGRHRLWKRSDLVRLLSGGAK